MVEGASTASDNPPRRRHVRRFPHFTAAARSVPQDVVDLWMCVRGAGWKYSTAHGGIVKVFSDGFWRCSARRSRPPAPRTTRSPRRAKMVVAMDRANTAAPGRCAIGIGIHFGEVARVNIGCRGARNTL